MRIQIGTRCEPVPPVGDPRFNTAVTDAPRAIRPPCWPG